MVSGRIMIDIAKATQMIEDQKVKDYVVRHWNILREVSRTADDEWGKNLIDLFSREDLTQIQKYL